MSDRTSNREKSHKFYKGLVDRSRIPLLWAGGPRSSADVSMAEQPIKDDNLYACLEKRMRGRNLPRARRAKLKEPVAQPVTIKTIR